MASNETVSVLKGFPIAQIKEEHETLATGEWNPYTKQRSFPDSRTPPSQAFFSRAIDKWKVLISPYTPTHGLNCSPSDPVVLYVRMLIKVFGLRLTGKRQQVEVASSALMNIWLSIWTWLRTIHAHSHASKWPLYNDVDAANCSAGYDLLVDTLFVLFYSNPPTPLSILVGETNGVKKMMAAIWIGEGRDSSATFGFKAASYTATWPHYPPPGPILPQIVDQCQGGVAAARILLSRIKNNLTLAEPDFQSLLTDLRVMEDQLSGEIQPAGPALLRKALISHDIPFIGAMVDVLHLLLRDRVPQQWAEMSDFLQPPFVSISHHVNTTGRAYECAIQLNRGTIIALLANASSTCGSSWDRRFAARSGELLQFIGKFTIYKTFFRILQENISPGMRITSSKFRASKDPNCQQVSWLVNRVDEWAKIWGTERHFALDCGNTQVRGPKCAPSETLKCAAVHSVR
ncbi:hypothetical protein HWV62_13837 [Athelia sp. TMB]|nr:hypothetical protein HWV62_13837 [Athelia sp. TMB]